MTQRPEALVIGTSAGALDALSKVLPFLPPTFPLPVMVVVHLPPDKKSILAELFQKKCQLKVKEAEDKEPIQAGTIYFAPADYHLLVEQDRRLSLSSDEPVLYSRPSIDVLFETAADAYGAALIGLILTGANNDGAHGLKLIEQYGGRALVQQPEGAYATAMPAAAIAACTNPHILPLQEISDYLLKATQS